MRARSLLLTLLVLPAAGCFETEEITDVLEAVRGRGTLDEATVADGLREALRIGAERAIGRTSQPGGFLDSGLIRIPIPEELQKATDTMRRLGLDREVDELEVAMNRAAERASGEAVDAFAGVVREMTIADAFEILRGEPTAATQYFRARTESDLLARFRPIVQEKMADVGIYELYNEIVDRIRRIPLIEAPELDLDDYGRAEPVVVANPLGEETSTLMTALLPGLLPVVRENLNHRAGAVRLFEVANTFRRSGGRWPYREVPSLAAVLAGSVGVGPFAESHREVDFFDLKGILENALELLGITNVEFVAILRATLLRTDSSRRRRFGVGESKSG